MTTTEVEKPVATTYGWLSQNALASSAGNTLYSWYDSSKKCCRLSEYAFGTVECSVKYAAETAAPIVKKLPLEKPIQAVDSFTANQLVKLEEKVPVITSQPAEVADMLSNGKDAVCSRISTGKEAVYTRVQSGKDAVYAKVSAGSSAVANSRAGVLVSSGKEAIATRITSGKESLTTRLANGRDVVYSKVQAGSEVLANTRAGVLLGSGIDRSISATETVVEYLLPPEENEKELLSEAEKSKKIEMVEVTSGLPRTRQPSATTEEEDVEEEEEVDEEIDITIGRVGRVKILSKKVKLRMYYRSLRKLSGVQAQCKSTLEQLKSTLDVLQMAQNAREKASEHYKTLQVTMKELEAQIKTLLAKKATTDQQTSLLPEEEGEKNIEWLDPKPKGSIQAALDYAKQLSERVYTSLHAVTRATSLLPHHLKDSTTHAFGYAQEFYTTLKSAKAPTDLPASALKRLSEMVDTQLGYCRQLGTFLSNTLQRKPAAEPKEVVIEDEDEESRDDDKESTTTTSSSSTAQPPGSEVTNEDTGDEEQ